MWLLKVLKGQTKNQVPFLQHPSCYLWLNQKSGTHRRTLQKLNFCCSHITQLLTPDPKKWSLFNWSFMVVVVWRSSWRYGLLNKMGLSLPQGISIITIVPLSKTLIIHPNENCHHLVTLMSFRPVWLSLVEHKRRTLAIKQHCCPLTSIVFKKIVSKLF